ncbi:MAG: ABC transporter permease [Betaproteobacteria bacterium]
MTASVQTLPPTAQVVRGTPLAAVALASMVALLVAVPAAGLLLNLGGAGAADAWDHLAGTVLAGYAVNSVLLCTAVGAGTLALGAGCAWLTTAYRFPGASWLSWLLLLPMAMPAYVVAYAYCDLLQFAGPVQSWLRESFGWRAREYWFPEIRSLGGATALLVLALYPYVYLPARAAFLDRPASLAEAARLGGAGAWRRFARIELPLAWPALAGGVLLVVMETLADYGTVSQLAVDTFSVGIFKAWLGLGDRAAASQLALLLLAAVALLMLAEQRLRGERRFAGRAAASRRAPPRLGVLGSVLAVAICLLPPLLGFVLPALHLVRLAADEAVVFQAARLAAMAGASFGVAAAAALLVTGLAVLLGYVRRIAPGSGVALLVRFASLGYAVPGAVLAIGILVPLARLDNFLDALADRWFGMDLGLLLTGSVAALLYAYGVRFLAVGLNTVEGGLARITGSMDEAARGLGVSGWRLLARVHLPLLRGPVWVAALLVFVDVLKELPATLALRPFGFETFATHAYALAKDERLADAAVPSLMIVAVALLPVLWASRALRARP